MHYLLLASLSTTQTISVAAGGVVTLGVLVAIFNVWTSFIHERRRTQPIAISHERHERRLTDKSDYFAVGGYLTNEGGGPAFNVRFGVEFGGVRYPQKMYPDDPDAGNVQRVLRPGERRPPGDAVPDSWPILIPALALIGAAPGAELDPTRIDRVGQAARRLRQAWACRLSGTAAPCSSPRTRCSRALRADALLGTPIWVLNLTQQAMHTGRYQLRAVAAPGGARRTRPRT